MVGSQTFETIADASGQYSIRIETDNPSDFVQLFANGAPGQEVVSFASAVGSFGRLLTQAGVDGVLSVQENAQVDITHLTTAWFVLLTEANAGVLPSDDATLLRLSQNIEPGRLLESAAIIQLVVDGGLVLPTGISDVRQLLSSPDALAQFKATLADGVLAQAIANVLANPPAGTDFAAGRIPLEYAVFFPSPVGAVQSIDGGAWMFLRIADVDRASGTGELLNHAFNFDTGTSWELQAGKLVITPRHQVSAFQFPVLCSLPGEGFVNGLETVTRVVITRIVNAPGVDTLQVDQFFDRTFTDPDPSRGCELPPNDNTGVFSYGVIGFKDTGDAELHYQAAELSGRLMLPYHVEASEFSRTSAIFDLDAGMTTAFGLMPTFNFTLQDGRLHTVLTREDGSFSYAHEYRRYRRDGRKGDGVMALVTRADGATAISGGMSSRVDGSLVFDAASLPGIYRSGLELGNFPGMGNGSLPFFITFNADGQHTSTRTSIQFDENGIAQILTSPAFQFWATVPERVTLRSSSSTGPKARDWQAVARDGNRIYVLERLFVGSAEAVSTHRSAFYSIVDAIRVERPE
ncbi:MAG: hypothetical protein Q8L45_14745 [Xanthomonadaceae bacterium]|nr:hypothetical protein [Xanthomonadaceae bacterium]MDP2187036.1 hypothetical protein [Xanthomonadales bacterium]